MKKLKILPLLMLFVFISILTGCSRNDNELIMVTEAGFAPYEYYQNNEIVGVDVEVGKKIAEKLGKKLVVRDVAFDSIINELNSGKADFAAAGMSITEERAKQVDFTIEYAVSNQVIVVNKNNTSIKTGDDLHGKTVAVQLGTTADLYMEDQYADSILVTEKKFLTAAEDVKAGKADAIVMDELPAKELVSNNPDLVILDGILFTDKYGMAVKKGNTELLNNINEVLQELVNDGSIEKYTIEYSE